MSDTDNVTLSDAARGTPSRGRLLLELSRRFGSANLDTAEATLFAAFMLDGGDYMSPDDAAYEAWIDELDDPNAVVQQVAEYLTVDPPTAGTPSRPSSSTRPSPVRSA